MDEDKTMKEVIKFQQIVESLKQSMTDNMNGKVDR